MSELLCALMSWRIVTWEICLNHEERTCKCVKRLLNYEQAFYIDFVTKINNRIDQYNNAIAQRKGIAQAKRRKIIQLRGGEVIENLKWGLNIMWNPCTVVLYCIEVQLFPHLLAVFTIKTAFPWYSRSDFSRPAASKAVNSNILVFIISPIILLTI